MINEPKSRPIQRWLSILLWAGFIMSCLLLATLALGLAFNTTGSNVLFYVLIPVLIPLPFAMLILLYYTRVPFHYSERKRDKIVSEFKKDIFGNIHTRDDVTWVRKDQAKKWHPDLHPGEDQQFRSDVLARISIILDELDREIMRTGRVDWSTKNWRI